jgi:SAM-dependent MidA family methyltransferase
LLGLWAAEMWSRLGAPPRLLLVELGPGRGALMADALRAARAAPGFFVAIEVHLVEASDKLIERQREALAASGRPVHWHRTLDSLPPGPAILLANEFFDALPVRHYVKTPEGWREKLVGLDARGELAFGLAAEVEPALTAPADEGALLEIGAAAQAVMGQIARRIVAQDGAFLTLDYGYARTTFGETLQAVKAHRFVDVLAEPGTADLTTHVDFSALARAAEAAHAQAFGPVGQGAFLLELGMARRAETLKRRATLDQAAQIDSALARLTGTGEGQMGGLFKVLAATRRGVGGLPGFAGA